MRILVLLLVNIFCLAKFVKSYGVTEHRVDYIKTVDGHEYDYHYHDGSAPRFEKSKLHHLQQPQQHQRFHNFNNHQQQQQVLRSKRPYKQPFKQPYFNKFFTSGNQEHSFAHNEFQAAAAAAPSYSSISSSSSTNFKQQNSIPIFESHEKIRHSFIDHNDDDDDGKTSTSNFDYETERPIKRRPITKPKPSTKPSSIIDTSLHGFHTQNNGHRVNQYHGYDDSSESVEALAKPLTGSSHSSAPFHFLSNNSSPTNIPGFHYISGGYSYFSSHPVPKKKKLQPIVVESTFDDDSDDEPVIATTTRRPYVAPTLTTTPTPPAKYHAQQRPTKAPVQRRPYIAPALTTTKQPYVAPSVLQSTGKVTDASLLAFGQNGASRFRYTNRDKAAASTTGKKSEKQSDLYEPEFDIDIRIDLSSDAAQ
nr:uncharacterized protein LOC109623085 [Aedes albopictus]